MAGIDLSLTVADAGPIIHLDELGCLDLLGDFGTLLIPREVSQEIARHRPLLTPGGIPGAGECPVDAVAITSPRLHSLIGSFRLDAGETAAFSLVEARRAGLFLCDDAAARLVAELMGFPVHGTIGVLARSIRRGTRSRGEILDILRRIPQACSLHISRGLLATVVASIEHEPE